MFEHYSQSQGLSEDLISPLRVFPNDTFANDALSKLAIYSLSQDNLGVFENIYPQVPATFFHGFHDDSPIEWSFSLKFFQRFAPFSVRISQVLGGPKWAGPP